MVKIQNAELVFNGNKIYHESFNPIASSIVFRDGEDLQYKYDNFNLEGCDEKLKDYYTKIEIDNKFLVSLEPVLKKLDIILSKLNDIENNMCDCNCSGGGATTFSDTLTTEDEIELLSEDGKYILTEGIDIGECTKQYIHEQNIPSNTWTIKHNLGKIVDVNIIDENGSVVYTSLEHVDNNTVIAHFISEFSGKAFCQ